MRSISLYGLSDVRMTFQDETDNSFARQEVFQRLADLSLPSGVTPSLAPLFSPSGLVYRYVIESPDRTPQELKTFEDWVIERQYKSVPGVADDSGFGGTEMQYQVLLDPAAFTATITVPQVVQALSANNANTGGGLTLGAVLPCARAGPARHQGHAMSSASQNGPFTSATWET
jgi:cobalt-zinc-cadmium resistance protein CzcA